LYGDGRIGAKSGKFSNRGRGEATDLSRGHRDKACQLGQGFGIAVPTQLQYALHGSMVRSLIHRDIHSSKRVPALANEGESADMAEDQISA
jgi:hypothetical protein